MAIQPYSALNEPTVHIRQQDEKGHKFMEMYRKSACWVVGLLHWENFTIYLLPEHPMP